MEGGVSITTKRNNFFSLQTCSRRVRRTGDRVRRKNSVRGDFCKRAFALPRAILPARSSRAMASYGVPPALGVAPEMMEEISTGVRARSSPVHAATRAISPDAFKSAPRTDADPSFSLRAPPADHHHGVPVRRRRGPGRRFPHVHRDVRREQSLG